MRRFLLAAAAWLLLAVPAMAQSGCPYIVYGAVLTPQQWNFCFTSKQDQLGYTPVNKGGDTMLGSLVTTPSTTLSAGFSIPPGTPPGTPINGNIWETPAGIFARVNGGTIGPLSASSSGSFAATAPLTVSFPASVVTYGIVNGTSVANPGTGTLETLVPVQTVTGASKTYATSDLFQRTRRSNSGSAMTDTLPADGMTGLVNGTRIEIANVDSIATDTISAGAGTTILGASSFVLAHGRDLMLTYDLANTAWRSEANTSLTLRAGLTGNAAYYINPSSSVSATCGPAGISTCQPGSDTTGNGTIAAPFQSWARAASVISATVDFAGGNLVTVYLAHGSLSGGSNPAVLLNGPWPGANPTTTTFPGASTCPVTLMGDSSGGSAGPTATVITSSSAYATILLVNGACLSIDSVDITNTGSGSDIQGGFGQGQYGNVILDASGGSKIFTGNDAVIEPYSNYWIKGNSSEIFSCQVHSSFFHGPYTVTFLSNITATYFVHSVGASGCKFDPSITWSLGSFSFTGQNYFAENGGNILIGNTGNTAFFPGTAGANPTAAGGTYDGFPLQVTAGGTGGFTFGAHGVLLGEAKLPFNATAALTNGQLLIGQTGADPLPETISGDATLAANGALTFGTVNSNVGTFGGANAIPQITVNGKGQVTAAATVTAPMSPPGGRLTLQSGTPVMTTSQTAKTTIYYDCSENPLVPYYNGTGDLFDSIASCEVSDAMANSGTGVINSGDMFDVWWAHGGANRICVATNGSGGGWASDGGSTTARGTGYSQLDNSTRGYVTNKNAITHCYNGATDYGSLSANQATYLGSFFTTAAGTTTWNLGSSAAGGGIAQLYLWNRYNRVSVRGFSQDSNTSESIASSATPAALGSTSFRISFVSGQALDGGDFNLTGAVESSSTLDSSAYAGMALDATNVFDRRFGCFSPTAAIDFCYAGTHEMTLPQIGLHFVQAVASGDGTNAGTFFPLVGSGPPVSNNGLEGLLRM